ncbi:MAG: hypothetical protein WD673_01590 [Alphaproteobacteria bacterium]
MSTPRRVRFAVLDGSLLARKGEAIPAIPLGPEHDDAVTRADVIAQAEAHHTPHFEHKLGELIVRPTPAHPPPDGAERDTGPKEPDAMDGHVPVASARAATTHGDQGIEDERSRQPARRSRDITVVEPRGLSREQANRYVGLSGGTFKRLVDEGVLPAALPFGRRRVWDRRALDQALDRLSGIDARKEASDDH